MKKNLLLPLVALLFFSCSTDGFKITGTINGGESDMIYLQRVEKNELVDIDSVMMNKGKFNFQGKVNVPDLYALQFGKGGERLIVFLENTKIKIEGSIDSVMASKIQGSLSHDLMLDFNNKQDEFSQKLMVINTQYYTAASNGTLTPEVEDELRTQFSNENNKLIEFVKGFVKENSTSPVAAYITLRHLAHQIEIDTLEAIVKKFPVDINESPFVVILNERIALDKRTAIGQPYTDFTLANPEGAMVSLSSMVGSKYLLVDFWAAWCAPCRKENPNLVSIYKKFKPLGFEMFGVSLDRERQAWVDAIKNDGLTWPQVSDLGGWESSVVSLYGINSIPANILLDQSGNIVAKNVKGDDLEIMLSQLFAK
jgi:peroxiredoxin